MTRPRLATLLLLLPIAVAVNVGVAVVCSLRVDVTRLPPRDMAGAEAANVREVWHRRRPAEYPDVAGDARVREERAVGFRLRMITMEQDDAAYNLAWVETGWPLRTLRGGRWRVVDLLDDPSIPGARMIAGRRVYDEALVVLFPSGFPWLPIDAAHFMPYEPIWWGVAINTLAFAVVLWCLLAAARWTRGRHRARRGRCPGCGYLVGASSACTECGHGILGR